MELTRFPLNLKSSYDPRNAAAAPLPLVVYVHDLSDPFTTAMLSSNASIDTFLQQVQCRCWDCRLVHLTQQHPACPPGPSASCTHSDYWTAGWGSSTGSAAAAAAPGRCQYFSSGAPSVAAAAALCKSAVQCTCQQRQQPGADDSAEPVANISPGPVIHIQRAAAVCAAIGRPFPILQHCCPRQPLAQRSNRGEWRRKNCGIGGAAV